MKTKQIIDTLQEYNDWRRSRGKWDVDTFNKGESLFDTITAHEIGLTLDAAIEKLKQLDKEEDWKAGFQSTEHFEAIGYGLRSANSQGRKLGLIC